MIEVEFFSNGGNLSGFRMKGHSGYAENGSDIVCASVSSAAYMAANTITEIIGLEPDITVDDGFMELRLASKDADKASEILSGFYLHMLQLEEQYPKYIKVIKIEILGGVRQC